MADITRNDEMLMEAAREVLNELTEKTVGLYGETDNSTFMDLKRSAGKDVSSAELTSIMHMLVFISDDSISAKMTAAVETYSSS